MTNVQRQKKQKLNGFFSPTRAATIGRGPISTRWSDLVYALV